MTDLVPNQPPTIDYTKQLDQIVSALNHRGIPEWFWGALVGWVLGIASTMIAEWFKAWTKRRTMRRMLYREMAENYGKLKFTRHRAMKPAEEKLMKNIPLEFGAYEWAIANRDLFEGLTELVDVEAVYSMFRDARELDPDDPLTAIRLNSQLKIFEGRVARERFSTKLLLRVSSSLRFVKPVIEELVRTKEAD